ncbi:hypothetical protein [Streptomyces sp. NPDC046862]|uniref:hypothetical protein n=1 Tax=Streptomyces sp. NPDC046862 TaxID=3154603 RepID=UPI00345239DB
MRLLWAYRSRLADHLGQDPLRRALWQAWARANPRRYDENLTARIPEHVIGPMLTWALRWVHLHALTRAAVTRHRSGGRPVCGRRRAIVWCSWDLSVLACDWVRIVWATASSMSALREPKWWTTRPWVTPASCATPR